MFLRFGMNLLLLESEALPDLLRGLMTGCGGGYGSNPAADALVKPVISQNTNWDGRCRSSSTRRVATMKVTVHTRSIIEWSIEELPSPLVVRIVKHTVIGATSRTLVYRPIVPTSFTVEGYRVSPSLGRHPPLGRVKVLAYRRTE